MEVTKIPMATPDPLADRHARIAAGFKGAPAALDQEAEEARKEDKPKRQKDALELWDSLDDQQRILRKKIQEVRSRHADSRQEVLRECAARAFKIMETIKEMQG